MPSHLFLLQVGHIPPQPSGPQGKCLQVPGLVLADPHRKLVHLDRPAPPLHRLDPVLLPWVASHLAALVRVGQVGNVSVSTPVPNVEQGREEYLEPGARSIGKNTKTTINKPGVPVNYGTEVGEGDGGGGDALRGDGGVVQCVQVELLLPDNKRQ